MEDKIEESFEMLERIQAKLKEIQDIVEVDDEISHEEEIEDIWYWLDTLCSRLGLL